MIQNYFRIFNGNAYPDCFIAHDTSDGSAFWKFITCFEKQRCYLSGELLSFIIPSPVIHHELSFRLVTGCCDKSISVFLGNDSVRENIPQLLRLSFVTLKLSYRFCELILSGRNIGSENIAHLHRDLSLALGISNPGKVVVYASENAATTQKPDKSSDHNTEPVGTSRSFEVFKHWLGGIGLGALFGSSWGIYIGMRLKYSLANVIGMARRCKVPISSGGALGVAISDLFCTGSSSELVWQLRIKAITQPKRTISNFRFHDFFFRQLWDFRNLVSPSPRKIRIEPSLLLAERYRNGGADEKHKFNQTASSASPSPTC